MSNKILTPEVNPEERTPRQQGGASSAARSAVEPRRAVTRPAVREARRAHRKVGRGQVLLGDEAVALGAIHAGISAAYAYPGTPSTEITEYLLRHAATHGAPKAAWTANEKTAYEAALGVSMVGRRSLVSMKHVGLNVAADPFVNSALVSLHGGLVLAVADDPSMHSSQNEQDSRYYADFARVVCLEPATHQEAYDMTREAFEISEGFQIPVLLRLVTRLAHSRSAVHPRPGRDELPLASDPDTRGWTLLPAYARQHWHDLLGLQETLQTWSEHCDHNILDLQDGDLGVITTGLARNYYRECLEELGARPSHLHIGAYPFPVEKIRALAARVGTILVLEEGYPYLERYLRGLLPGGVGIRGKISGELRPEGELGPEVVRAALGLPERERVPVEGLPVPKRPPQLCSGCPHTDTYRALSRALDSFERGLVTSDIGCYTLGALPPHTAIESCVCMGASVGMARGASEAGFHPVVAVIGDSTFLHSGVTPLIDAVAADVDMTLLILDNRTVGMTGGQPTILPSEDIRTLVAGLGVDPAHLRVLEAHPKRVEQMAAVLREEMEHRGLSVIVSARECIEAARRRKAEEKKKGNAA
jgi:indolepyruvate ferredoxin oxidoreductase alpha subunit